MVRLSTVEAQRVLTCLAWISKEYTWRDIWRATANAAATGSLSNEITPEEREQIALAISQREGDRLTPESLMVTDLRSILAQLNANEEANVEAERTLLEKLLEIVQQPYARQMITNEMLKSLRRVLLLPNELASVEFDSRALYCFMCGHKFEGNEMATFRNGAFCCTRCSVPTAMACTNCKKTAKLDNRTTGVLAKAKHICEACEHPEQVSIDPGPEAPTIFAEAQRVQQVQWSVQNQWSAPENTPLPNVPAWNIMRDNDPLTRRRPR